MKWFIEYPPHIFISFYIQTSFTEDFAFCLSPAITSMRYKQGIL